DARGVTRRSLRLEGLRRPGECPGRPVPDGDAPSAVRRAGTDRPLARGVPASIRVLVTRSAVATGDKGRPRGRAAAGDREGVERDEPEAPARGRPAAPGAMYLLLAVVHADDAGPAIEALTGAGWRVTRIPTVGGFLRQANATLVIGVERVHLPRVLGVLRAQCRTRTVAFV